MSSEETLIQVRRDKHQEINGGTYPLPTEAKVLSTQSVINTFVWEPSMITIDPTKLGLSFTMHGRIVALRKSGGITFAKLTDSSGSIQLLLSKSILSDYDRLRLLDLGDIVEVIGQACLSKTNEKSLLVSNWNVLTKAHRPPPEKFVGIVDMELKYRKRYLDLMSSEESRARFTVRTYILRAIRDFMDCGQFLEVETPTLAAIASGANAKPFETHHNALDIPLRLRIAPELYLKRLLVGGMDRVYEIGRNYRNEGIDTRHNPEFTMMESYQAYGNFPDLIAFTRNLLQSVVMYLDKELPSPTSEYWQQWKKDMGFSFWQCVEVPMFEAVVRGMRAASIDPDSAHTVAELSYLDPSNPRIQKIDSKAMMHAMDQCRTEDARIAVLFEYVAEPFLVEDYEGRPVFITKYPKSLCPLARANDKHPDECDRFELFVEGRELANAFQELNDPDEQALRFKEQLEAGGKDPMAYDADYVEALQHGMPPAIGFGMGIDRLVMLLTNTSSIKDVILFPTLRPEK